MSTPTARERLRALAPELAAALLVALLCFYRSRRGLSLSPDAWAMWEGSVSLLERGTFAYFAGDPIRYWPPLPALLLAATQGVLGVSCGAALAFVAAVSGLGWLGWSRLAAQLLAEPGGPPPPRALRLAVGLLQAALVLGAGTVLLGHVLVLAVLPWFLCALLDLLHGSAEERVSARLRLGATGAALLLTHHTSAAFLAGAGVWLATRGRGRRELALDLAPLGAASLIWLGSRLALDQAASHALLLGGRSGPVGHAVEAVTGIGGLVAPTRGGWLPLPAGLVLLGLAAATCRSPAVPAARVLASVGLGALVGLFFVFNVIWVADPLNGRFVWFFPFLAVPPAAAVLARRSRPAALALVLVAAALPTARWVVHSARPAPLDAVPLAAWISTRPLDASDPRAADRIEPWVRPWGVGTSAVEDMRTIGGPPDQERDE